MIDIQKLRKLLDDLQLDSFVHGSDAAFAALEVYRSLSEEEREAFWNLLKAEAFSK